MTLSAPATVNVPGPLPVSVTTTTAPDAELSGYVVLTRGTDRRRIPYWFRTGTPALGNAAERPLRRAGVYSSTTKGGTTRVARYRYPESPAGLGFATALPGPERVFRVTLARPATNFGVVVTSRAKNVRVEPRIVLAGDERRLTGYAALPFNLNPYLRTFGDPVLAAGTILPAAGAYDVVFDSPSAADRRRVLVPLLAQRHDATGRARSGRGPSSMARKLVVAVSDRGAGVDPASLVLTVDGAERPGRFAAGQVRSSTAGLRKGKHVLRLQISDYQETRNMENVGPILPNTRILTTSFVVR